MIRLQAERLKKILVESGIVQPAQFEAAETEAKRKQQNIVDLLVSQGLITLSGFYELLARHLNVSRINMGAVKIDEAVLKLIPQDVAEQRRVILFGRGEDGYYLAAMEDPTDLETIDFLERRLNAKVRVYLATDADLNRGFALYEAQLTKGFERIVSGNIQEALRAQGGRSLSEAAAELPIVEIVDNFISYAITLRSTDIHFELLEDAILVRYRIDGILHEIIKIPKAVHPAIAARVKLLSGLRIDEHLKPQDGRFRYKSGNDTLDIRVAIMPTFYGEKIEMRLLPATQRPISLEELGMFPDTAEIIRDSIKKTYGMVLVCGPTGSGKTTTLYSILNILNRPEVNIVTIEDPIEYNMDYVNQTQVNPAAGITFASGLRAILRQDPNIVMVGEIRDSETADIAVQAALTGHLVLSSIHTNDAPTAIPRLLDMGIPSFLIAAVSNIVSAQRLTRRLHQDCAERYEPDKAVLQAIEKELADSGIPAERIRLPKVLYRAKGCSADAGSGYLGRLGIYEVLHVTEEIRKLVVAPNFSLDAVRRKAREEGMITMFEDGLRKAEKGLTSLEEVLRVIKD